MIFAMIAFLIVTMIALVIVSAAITNSKRIEKQRKYEQAYLTAQSIAGVVADRIVDTSEDHKRHVNVTYQPGTDEGVSAEVASGSDGFDEKFLSALKELCEERQGEYSKKYLGSGTGETSDSDDSESGVVLISLKKTEAKPIIPEEIDLDSSNLPDYVKNQIGNTNITLYMPDVKNGASGYYDMVAQIDVPIDPSEPGRLYSTQIKFTGASKETDSDGNYETDIWWEKATVIN